MTQRMFLARAIVLLGALTVAAASDASAQAAAKKPKKKADSTATPQPKKIDSLKPLPPMYASEVPLHVSYTANLRALRGDKGDTSPWRSATISYVDSAGKTVTVPMRAKTHGAWRLRNCAFPPIRLDVANKDAKGTLFHGIEKPKFVNICRNTDRFEQHVLQEMQLYRIYQLLTPASHRVRTWRVTYRDSASGKEETTRYGFVFEDPDELAARLGGRMIKTKGAGPDDFDGPQLALAFVFQYMIANTDFSFSQLHNGELVMKAEIGAPVIPIAYDFDFAGAVNAPYATVDPQLTAIRRVRQRLFRGYCMLAPHYPAAIARFNEKKDAIYALYRDDVGKLLDPDIVKQTLEYFDEFYQTIGTGGGERMLETCVGRR